MSIEDIKQNIERTEVLLSTALEELSYAKADAAGCEKSAPEDTVEILRAQNRELYEENDKLRQEIGFLRIKANQAASTATYRSVLQDNDSLRTRNAELENRVNELMKDNNGLRSEELIYRANLLVVLDKLEAKMLTLKEKIDELAHESERLTYIIEQEDKRRCWFAFWVESEAGESVNHEIPLQQSVRLLIDKYRLAKE